MGMCANLVSNQLYNVNSLPNNKQRKRVIGPLSSHTVAI